MRKLALLMLALVACGGIDDPLALDQPIQAQQAEYKRGALPVGASQANITSYSLEFGVLRPGARNAIVRGRASTATYAVGIRIADQGEGYWVRPVGAEDPLLPGELQWTFSLDASVAIEPGQHQLEVVAFDGDGKAGAKQALTVCVASDIPDNNNACNPKAVPPLLVASLSWETDADLDLVLEAPDGTRFDRSKRSLLVDGKVVARLDGDGVTSCLGDGQRRESFVWNDAPPTTGRWLIYANLFDACTKPAAGFTLTIYRRVDKGNGDFALEPTRTLSGNFVRQQANGGAGSPLYLTYVNFSAL